MPDWKDEVARLDIADVAQKLGVQVTPGRRSPRLAICPFHEDSQPSLYLYQDNNPHYHCFACHAHGDTVELVKQRRSEDFSEALAWLSTTYRIDLGGNKPRRTTPGQDIRQRALDFFRQRDDNSVLKPFADARGFTSEDLKAAGITGGAIEIFLQSLIQDRASQDDAVEAGLAYAADIAVPNSLRSPSLSPFVRGDALLIPLANLRGKVTGVMARPLTGGGPKYRFTAGLRKSEILYRGDHIRRQLDATNGATLDQAEDRFDLFLVEGVFDALRLETLGLPAVAILGSSISDAQADQVSELAELALEKGRVLRLHLFLDADRGGRTGLADALPRMLRRAAEAEFLVDAVTFDRPDKEKADPDSLLRGLSPEVASATLVGQLTSALDALAAIALGVPFAEIGRTISMLDAAGSIMLQNRLARRLQKLDWPKIWRKVAPAQTTLGLPATDTPLLLGAYERLARDLEAEPSRDAARALPEPFGTEGRSADANLLHAMVLARESADTREYPVDIAAWDRIDEGATAFLPVIDTWLGEAQGPRRPYLAHFEAKDSGAPRLKCGPCPEDAVQQQYVLSELLRVRPDNREVAEQIPAVRYWSDQQNLVVTGATRPETAVSFAYQIDMRALEERPDRTRRRDMFRPFLDCWNSFIRHIGGRIERMQCDLIYVARLDIKGFYDHVPRHAVARVLNQALPSDETLRLLNIAPRLGTQAGDRHATLLRWLLDHSFGPGDQGYAYVSPGSGNIAHHLGGGAKGLPQGPVLSSYLANIVLFDLDKALEARVRILDAEAAEEEGPRTCGAAYARYVDDIVIAARSPDDLRGLRGEIEAKLEALGLELNEKSEHLAPMTAEEARNWVVERRGAGFMAYGDLEDQPSPVADLRTSWADIPSLDRRTALSVLHWSALDDPEQTPREDFEALILKVSQAEALRPPDLGHIARRVLLRASLDAQDDPVAGGSPSATDNFILHTTTLLTPIRGANPASPGRFGAKTAVGGALLASREYLAVLMGLERLVSGAPEANPTFSPSVRDAIAAAKAKLIDWILNEDLLTRLEAALIAEPNRAVVRTELGAQLEIQRAGVEERAARTLRLTQTIAPLKIQAREKIRAPATPGAAIIRIGWLRTFCPDGLDAPLATGNALEFDELLHVIAAGAQVEGGRAGAKPEALSVPSLFTAVSTLAESAFGQIPGLAADGSNQVRATFRALAGAATEADLVPDNALPALLALAAGPGLNEALGRRQRLFQTVIPNAVILPVPPLPGQPGLFCYQSGRERRIHAVFTAVVDDPLAELPGDLVWSPGTPVGDMPCWTATLPLNLGFLLGPHGRLIDDDLATIADVFEGLVQRYGHASGPRRPLVNVFSLIGPIVRTAEETSTGYFSLSWNIARDQCERLIFERRGDGLALQRSPHAGAELWRIGQSVSDLFAIPQDTEAEEDAAAVQRERRLLQARLKRTAFSRLRGRWISDAQVSAALATGTIPRALERIIKALREASGSEERVGPLALEFLLSGRAMRSRMRLGNAVDVPGGWARFLEAVGGGGLRTGDDEGLFAQADIRADLARPSRAFMRAADTVTSWAALAEEDRCREALATTALGFELASLRLELRDTVLAILARLSPQGLERLGRVRPDLAALGGFGSMLLVDPRFGHGEARVRADRRSSEDPWAYESDWQARDLFVTLGEALGMRALQGRAALERISTAGWLTVLAVMAGALDFRMEAFAGEDGPPLRPGFFPLTDTSAAVPLKSLAARLLSLAESASPAEAEIWPWELTSTLDRGGLHQAIAAAKTALNAVRSAAGVVQVIDPAPLRSLSIGERTAEFFTADGDRYELPWWRCTLTATTSERLDRTETVAQGDRRFNPCSMLTDGRDVLLLQVLSESLSKITGLQLAEASSLNEPPESAQGSQAEAPTVETPESISTIEPPPLEERASHVVNSAATDEADVPDVGFDPTASPPSPPSGTPSPSPSPSPSGGNLMASFKERQNRAWAVRGTGAGLEASGYGRVAILQYDFLDSYNDEAFPKYVVDGKFLDRDLRIDAGVVDYRLSFEEHRRRQVLASVLACCHNLGVEALVLPEYSAHPETVSWIERYCRDRKYRVSVWAGTFRQQPGFALTLADGRYQPIALDAPKVEARPMETHFSVVFRETQPGAPISLSGGNIADEAPIFRQKLIEGIRHRQKKYPSIGMAEEFKPHNQTLQPLMAQSRSVQRIESFINELICSELFVFNGPLNWISIAGHLAASAARYKVDSGGVEWWLDEIVKDAKEAAKIFSGVDGYKPRRSLLFVTCATTRDADYHYFAQSAYLASGIVTAFCNGSGPGVTGGSCFVGQGGWETRGDGMVVPNPYHGAAPGILSNGPQRGALGPNENALIIADIRPERTVEDKPRSQALGATMRLVAHIPIVEAQSSSAVATIWDARNFRAQRTAWVDPTIAAERLIDPNEHAQLLHDAAGQPAIEIEDFVSRLSAVIAATEGVGSTLELAGSKRDAIIAAGVSLSGLFMQSRSMNWRASKLAKEHQTHPERLPCPSLLDWLAVDLEIPRFEQYLRDLRDHAKSLKVKASPISTLPPALRDAPWRWTARHPNDETG